nr:MAG TPA: hypothetical protein [Caudoviricetes sp.]
MCLFLQNSSPDDIFFSHITSSFLLISILRGYKFGGN